MKRGIIMERHRHYIVVMDKYGVFHKAEPVASAEVGAEVEFKPIQNGRFHRFLLTGKSVNKRTKIAVMTVLVMLITFPLYAWYNGGKVYAYVNVDINPSVEMEVDEAMKVKSIRPLNDDAEQILVELGPSWKNKTVEEVTSLLIEQGKKDQLIDGENVVIIGVSYLDGREKEKYITDTLDEYFNRHPQEELSVATFEVPEKIREAARSESKSMNELFAEEVDKQVESDTEALQIDDQEKELIQSYYHKDDHVEDKADDRDSGDTVTEQTDSRSESSNDLKNSQSDTVKQTVASQENREDSTGKTDAEKKVDTKEQTEKKHSNPVDDAKKTKKQETNQQKESSPKHDMESKSNQEHSMKHVQPEKSNKKKNKQANRKKQRHHQQKNRDTDNHSRGHGNRSKMDKHDNPSHSHH
ncbi:hypothetical protein ERJ70_04040 [Sediminibacillus dalangtanensis]|uniref:RsgI N-terminal anti-sigma domain-containing protein n=1 Tax=Sediminibacillus dalangtanensis TaxID=2729421 RepID=A0ABX7VPW9_9BACI|nr:hypothetical protein [Sediminibacillus dalangtanensis]QTM98538.1 hypothetical protein ERJ70_04040 [Sediminibacillus dalangtanensis]